MIERLADYLHCRLIFDLRWLELIPDRPATSTLLLCFQSPHELRLPYPCNAMPLHPHFRSTPLTHTHMRCPHMAMKSLAVVEVLFDGIKEVLHGSGHVAVDGDLVAEGGCRLVWDQH